MENKAKHKSESVIRKRNEEVTSVSAVRASLNRLCHLPSSSQQVKREKTFNYKLNKSVEQELSLSRS